MPARCYDPLTGLQMPPSGLKTLTLLRNRERVTTSDFLREGCGSRFGARIGELRHGVDPRFPDAKFAIGEKRLRGDVSGSEYWLIAQPEPVHAHGEARGTASSPPSLPSGAAGSSSHTTKFEGAGLRLSKPLAEARPLNTVPVFEQPSLFDLPLSRSVYGSEAA